MKVILKETMEKVGKAGEVVDISDGYARNFLLPQHKGIEATPSNMKLAEGLRKGHEVKAAKEKVEAEDLAKKLSSITIEIEAKAGDEGKLFGAVTSQHIALLLKEKGFDIDKRRIEIGEAIKALGTRSIVIALAHEVKATVTVSVKAASK